MQADHHLDHELKRGFLPPVFMITSIIGFLMSAIYTFSGKMDEWFGPRGLNFGENTGFSLGVAFCLVFLIMFISTMVSMTPKGDDF